LGAVGTGAFVGATTGVTAVGVGGLVATTGAKSSAPWALAPRSLEGDGLVFDRVADEVRWWVSQFENIHRGRYQTIQQGGGSKRHTSSFLRR
jgi:hypothetical protein